MGDVLPPNRTVRRSAPVAAAIFLAVLALGGGPLTRLVPAAAAQNLGDRTVSGTVLSPDSTPVAGAIVFLKNQKSKEIRSFTSLQNGHFHFAQVHKDQDYDLWAEKGGKKSTVKTVSSWDARTEFIADLKFK